MFNKKVIKKVFDEEFDSQKMRKQILLKYENKGEYKMFKVLKYVLPVCLIVLCGVLSINGKQNDLINKLEINKIDELGLSKLDADTKEISDEEINVLSSITENFMIPADLNKINHYGIYTRSNETKDYNILNCYVYNYSNKSSDKNIKIAFSNKNKPIRDYHFDEEGSIKSSINNNDLIVYQYEKTYFVQFNYNSYNFDIETNNISFDELTSLLTSIIK